MFNYFGRSSTDGADDRESAVSSYDYDDEEFEMLVKAFMQDINYTTVNQAAMNIACSMVNAGLVALPFVAQEAGIPLFFVAMLFLSIISGYTSVVVVSMANERRVRTLEDLAECAFGSRGFLLVSGMQLLFSFSLMIITLNVWADIMSDVFRHSGINAGFLHKRHYQIYLGAAIILPLCILKKSLSTLRWTSFITLFAVAGAFIAVVATYVSDQQMSGNYSNTTVEELCRPKGYWWAIVFISVYSFSCNQKVLTIYSSLRRRTADRWKTAMQRALTAVFLLYTFFGICGYISKDRRDIRIDNLDFFLSDLHEQRLVFDPARSLVAFSLLLTLPVDSLVAATTWRRLWAKIIKRRHQQNHGAPGEQDLEMTCCAVFCVGPTPSHSQSFESEDFEVQSGEQILGRSIENRDSRSEAVTNSLHTISSAQQAQQNQRRKMYHRHSVHQRNRQHRRPNTGTQLPSSSSPTPETSSSSVMSELYRSLFGGSDSSILPQTKYSPVATSQPTSDFESSLEIEDDEKEVDHEGNNTDNDLEESNFSELSRVYDSNRRSDVDTTDRDTMVSYRSYDHSRSRNNSDVESNQTKATSHSSNSNRIPLTRGKNLTSTQSTPQQSADVRLPTSNTDSTGQKMNNGGGVNGNNDNVNPRSSSNNSSRQAVLVDEPEDDNVLDQLRTNGGGGGETLYDQYNNLLEVTSPLPEREQVVPTLVLWLSTVCISLFVKDWTYLAGSLGTLSTVLLLFIIPALLYRRLKLVSDYEAIPIIGSIIPNQFYMNTLLTLGILILIFDVLVDGYFYASGKRIFQQT